MILRLERLFSNPGAATPIEETFMPEWPELAPFSLETPIVLSGRVENRAGVVTASLSATCSLSAPCDRCLEPVSIPVSLQVEQPLVRSLSEEEDEDRFLVLPNACLDTQEFIRCELMLDLPTRVLCKEDCLGLCPTCGGNRNQKACSCSGEQAAD